MNKLRYSKVTSLPKFAQQLGASQVALMVKNPFKDAGDVRHVSSILGSGRRPEGGHGNPLQYSFLENPMDRGACWAPQGCKESDMTEAT